jgi:hypothetical protein
MTPLSLLDSANFQVSSLKPDPAGVTRLRVPGRRVGTVTVELELPVEPEAVTQAGIFSVSGSRPQETEDIGYDRYSLWAGSMIPGRLGPGRSMTRIMAGLSKMEEERKRQV